MVVPIRTSRRRLAIGLVLLTSALAVFFLVPAWETYNSRGVDLPLRIDGKRAFSEPFRIRKTGSYRASLKLDSHFGFAETECLAGVHRAPPDCPPEFFAPQLEWLLLEANGQSPPNSTFYGYAGEYSKGVIGRSLASFVLKSGSTYILSARVMAAPGAYRTVNPRLELRHDNKGEGLMIMLLVVASSLILGIASAIMLLPLAWKRLQPS